MRKKTADAGLLIAALDARDEHHVWARQALEDESPPWLVCEPVLAEVSARLDFASRWLRLSQPESLRGAECQRQGTEGGRFEIGPFLTGNGSGLEQRRRQGAKREAGGWLAKVIPFIAPDLQLSLQNCYNTA
jgi:hypothetical protein